METELWPSLLFGCHDRRVPVYILNARLSARSLRGYSVLRPLIARTLRTVRKVAAQSGDDAARFVQLGALPGQVRDVGNLKFDMTPEGKKKKAIDKFVYHLELCTMCNLCIEACPTSAIKMAQSFEHSVFDRRDLTKVLNKPESKVREGVE